MAFEIFSIVGKIGLEGMSAVEAQMTKLQLSSKKTQDAMKKIGKGLTVFGGAIIGGMGLAMKSAADFETAMREVNTMMGLSQEEFAAFSSEVQAMSSDMGVDAVEAAKALYQAISAGVPKENVVDFLTIATKSAIGGVTDTATAVDGLTTVINAFKMPISEAGRVADIMFTTVKGGKTTIAELSTSLFNIAPIAAASDVAFKEVAAALATMTKQGIPTTIATTSLRQAMVTLQKPTADMAIALNDLGYESGQAMLDSLGLAGAFGELREYTGGSNEQLMKMLGSVEAGQAVLSLTGDSAQMFANDILAMGEAAGAADAAYLEMEQSVSRQMARLKSSFQDISISIGNILLPQLTSLLDKLKPIVEGIIEWIKENPNLTETLVNVALRVGGLSLVIGPLLIALPGLVAAFGLVNTAMLTGVAIGIKYIAIIGGLKYAADQISIAFKKVADYLSGANEDWEKTVGDFQDPLQWAKSLVGLDTLDAEFKSLMETIKETTEAAKNLANTTVAELAPAINDLEEDVKEATTAYEDLGEGVDNLVMGIGDAVIELRKIRVEQGMEDLNAWYADLLVQNLSVVESQKKVTEAVAGTADAWTLIYDALGNVLGSLTDIREAWHLEEIQGMAGYYKRVSGGMPIPVPPDPSIGDFPTDQTQQGLIDQWSSTIGQHGISDFLTWRKQIIGYSLGGIVPGPIGAPSMAIVHGGETITPAGKGGVSVNLNVYGSVTTERDLVDIIMSQAVPQIRNALGARN